MKKLYLLICASLLFFTDVFSQTTIHTNDCSAATAGWTFTNGTTATAIQQGGYWMVEDADVIISQAFNVSTYNDGLTLDFQVGTYGSGTPNKGVLVDYSLDNGSNWAATTFTSAVPASSSMIASGTFNIPASTATQFKLRFRKASSGGRQGVRIDNINLQGYTLAVSSITTTAIAAGTYPLVAGGNSITVASGALNAKGIIWGLTNASVATLVTPGATTTEGRWHSVTTSTANFTAPLAGVQPGTTIYYRAYFTTASATVLGDIKSYTVPSFGNSLSYWNFGADGASYSELPASNVLPAASLTPSAATGYDNNGKDGFIYNGVARGQALTWDNASNATSFVIRLNTTGYRDLHLRADYLAQVGGTYTMAYSTDGTSYTDITTTGSIPTNMTVAGGEDYNWGTFYHNLTSITALNNAPDVYLRFTLNSGVSAQFEVDNIHLFGTLCAVPAQPGTISGITTPVCSGTTQTYSITAISGATSYTWTLPPGWTGTSATNSITATAGTTGGTVSVVASNICGSSIARVSANIVVNPTPANPTGNITAAVNPVCGSTLLYYDNAAPDVYWQTAATGTSTANVSTMPLAVTTTGMYYVRTYNGSCWSAGSLASGTITVHTAPSVTGHPSTAGQTVCSGSALTALSVTATGTGLAYQWYSNAVNSNVGGTLISGAVFASYAPSNTLVGTTYYYCIVSGNMPCDPATSNVSGAVTVNPPAANPTGIITGTGSSCGSTTINYSAYTGMEYWQTTSNGTSTANPVAAGGNRLITASGNYYVRSRSAQGCWSTGQAGPLAVTIGAAASISAQPADRTVTSPTGTTFTITAANTTGYQWQYYNGAAWTNLANAAPYSGVTTATLTIASTTAVMDGTNYRCVLSATSPCTALNSAVATLYVNPGPCLQEGMNNLATGVSSYGNRSWTGEMGGTWTATDARTDQGINGAAITIRNGEVTSPAIANGIGSITMTTRLPFSDPAGNLTIHVNGTVVGTIPYSSGATTTTLANINIGGTVTVVIESPGARVAIDDISWSCYTSCTPAHTVTSITPASGPAGTLVTITGTNFNSITGVKFGETNAAGYTVVNATTIIAEVPVGAATNKIFVFRSACPVGTTGSFTVLTNNGNCNSASGSVPTDLMISEVFDSPSGSLGYVELYNGTAGTISLGNYKLQVNSISPITLSGSIAAGATAVFEYGTSGTACGSGSYTNLTGSGFNEDDDIKLLKGSGNTLIDIVTTPGYTGYSFARNSAVGAPSATFDMSQWDDINTSCANIGSVNFIITPIITVNVHPADKECLEPISFSVAAVANPDPVSVYRWMYNNPAVAGSGWQPVSGLTVTGVTFSGTNTATLSVTGFTAPIRNYQFYCELTKDLAVDCIVQSNAAQYKYDSRLYYKANVASGNWTTPGSWLMSDNASSGFAATCTYPVSANSDAVIIPAGTKIIHNANLQIEIDKVTVETGGELEIGTGAGLKIMNGGTGADMIINGTLIDNASSGAGNGIDYEDNTGTANDASWSLGTNGTIIKTNNSSAANYRDFYAGGIATIPATANWIYRYTGTGTPAVVAADMYYPNLSFESTSGAYSWNTATTALTGAANTIQVKGSLLIGNAGSGTVTVHYNNINALPMQIAGNLTIGTGSTLSNISYDNTVTATRGHGTGFDIKGNLTVNGTLVNTGAATQTGNLVFSGSTASAQIISGTGDMQLEDVAINNTGSGQVTVNKNFAIPGTLSFGSAAAKLLMNTGNITLNSSVARTANVAIVPAGTQVNYATGRFVVERYISHTRKWQLLSVAANSTQSIFDSWQEGGSNAPGYGVKITGPFTGNGLDAPATNNASMKYQAGTGNVYTPVTVTDAPNSINTSGGRGYYLYVYGDRTTTGGMGAGPATILRTTGRLFIGNAVAGEAPPAINLPVTNAENISVGNPFASAINFAALKATASNLGFNFKVWDPSQGGSYGAGIFQTISGPTGWLATPGGGSIYNGSGDQSTIQSGQAFFVQAASTGTINIPFAENIKVGGSRLVNRGSNETPAGFDPLSISMISSFVYNGNAALMDGNRVVLDPVYSNAVDDNDAIKLLNDGINFGIRKDGHTLAVEARPLLLAGDTIHYQLGNIFAGQYQLKLAMQNINEPLLQAELVDRFLNARTPISLTDSSFISFAVTNDAASAAANRFYIVFNNVAIVPVSFTTVRANRIANKTVDIYWKVENETNISRYEIERSSNGSSFMKVGEQVALYNGTGGQYLFNDVTAPSTMLYYRIKAIGINGEVQYSPVVKVNAVTTDPSFVVYPNPVTGRQVNVQLAGIEADAVYHLVLYDAAGKLVHKESIDPVAGNSTISLQLKNETAAGKYQLQVRNRKKTIASLPLIIQ